MFKKWIVKTSNRALKHYTGDGGALLQEVYTLIFSECFPIVLTLWKYIRRLKYRITDVRVPEI